MHVDPRHWRLPVLSELDALLCWVADFLQCLLAQMQSRLQLNTGVALPLTAEAHDFGAGSELFHMRKKIFAQGFDNVETPRTMCSRDKIRITWDLEATCNVYAVR